MAEISFETARTLTTQSKTWMKQVSDYINDPEGNPAPADIYSSQKLAFEINPQELQELINKSNKIIGILGYEEGGSLTVIFVGTKSDYSAQVNVLPAQTWPKLDGMDQLQDVLTKYLTP